MTATAVSSSAAAGSAFSRWQFWIVLLAVGAFAAIAAQLLAAEDTEVYGLGNTDLDGYAALAQVLQDEGVRIHRATSAEAAAELVEDHPQAQVAVLMRGFQPDEQTLDRLREHHHDGGQVLWISDDPQLLSAALGPQIGAGPQIPAGPAGTAEPTEAGDQCRLEAGLAGESLQAPGATLTAERGCFPYGSPDSGGPAYALAETSYGPAFSAPSAFTNQHIASQGHAAVALGLLGAHPGSGPTDLIWYTPSGADAAGTQQWDSPWDHLPGWVWPVTAWLLICGLIAMVVAGRRRGPVVSEPLPVSVPAHETAYGRGRLYQRADAAAEAARILRSAHLLRISRLLRLGPRPAADLVAEAAAAQLGGDDERVRSLLLDPQVRTSRQLSAYAQQLAQLEDDLRETTRMRRRRHR